MKKYFILGICFILVIIPSISACQKAPEVIVPIKMVGDEEYRSSRTDWETEANELLNVASEVYRKEFGIRFVATEFVEWDSPDLPSIDPSNSVCMLSRERIKLILDEAKRQVLTNGELVIVLTGEQLRWKEGGIERTEYGVAAPKDNCVVLWADCTKPVNSLVHEIGHIFGAEHTHKWGEEYMGKHISVMNPVFCPETTKFDPENREIILANRDKFQHVLQGGGLKSE